MMDAEDLPIAVRRPRRSSVGVQDASPSKSTAPTQPAKTPRRNTKTVRFSDPAPRLSSSDSGSSGLTPMIRRASIITPRRRRTSTPLRIKREELCTASHSSSTSRPALASPSLHHTIDGRINRRLRRNGIRDMINKMDESSRRKAQSANDQIKTLQDEVKTRDREIYELQNATVVIDTERIWDLEQQVFNLRKELASRGTHAGDQTKSYDWTLAARDPYADDDEYMDMRLDDEDDEFDDSTVAQLACSTPTRVRASASFPTPPATSPTMPMPGTPCAEAAFETPKSHVGVQVSLVDSGKQAQEAELASLQLEITKLNTTLDSYKSLTGRISNLISTDASPAGVSEVSATTDLEKQIGNLLQTMSDRAAAVTTLSSSIAELGFPGDDASDMLSAMTSGFRAVRLELEYLTPGEITLPLTSHGAEVLDLLLTRLRELATKAREDESAIDEYHEIEQSLRKQLDARVSVMDGLKEEMAKAEGLMSQKNTVIKDLQIGNDRLKGAVDSYIRDIAELEKLVEGMDREAQATATDLRRLQEESSETISSKDNSIKTLESKLADAVSHSQRLQKEMSTLQDSQTKHVVSLNQRHGAALALRDARVLELRGEIDAVNASLRSAHETIRKLRVENGNLESKVGQEKQRAKLAMDAMREELQKAMQRSQDLLITPKRPASKRKGDSDGDGVPTSPLRAGSRIETGGNLSGDVGTRTSHKKRRRYDSGLGFLDDEEVDI